MNLIVIIGGGHAAAQLCAGLAEAGQGARVHLVCEEPCEPYHRPPLSKAFLKSADEVHQPHKAGAWYHDAGITLHLGDAATAIDRAARTVTLRSGAVLPYESLVLATGTRARRLPGLPDGLDNVAMLRAVEEAHRLRTQLGAAQDVTVLGGGFIGLEVAATAKALGKTVRVLESAPRLLGRAVSAELSAHVLATHRAAGIDVVLNAKVDGFAIDGTRLAELNFNDTRQAIDLLLLGIGAVPETALARAAGLECADGIVVDAHMRTSDPQVLAIGDCTRFPDRRADRPLRLESVQNANDQAAVAAHAVAGKPMPYAALPWFWSDQYDTKLQIAGLNQGYDDAIARPGKSERSRSVWYYQGDTLLAVDAINDAAAFVTAKKLLERGAGVPKAAVRDPAAEFKTWLGA